MTCEEFSQRCILIVNDVPRVNETDECMEWVFRCTEEVNSSTELGAIIVIAVVFFLVVWVFHS